MAEFFYKGRDSSGRSVQGTLTAASKTALLMQLRRQEIIATQVSADTKQASTKNQAGNRPAASQNILSLLSRPKKASVDELIMFSRQMFALTRSGIPLIRAITGLSEASRSEVLSDVLKEVAKTLTQGNALSVAFRAHPHVFSELFVSMVSMGETTGRLDTAFKQLIDHLEMEKDTQKKIKSATRYPIIVVAAITVALVIINIVVVPAFSTVFEKLGADLPLATIILIATSNFMISYWPLLSISIAIAIVAFVQWKATPTGKLKWDQRLLKFPVMGGIYERIALGRFARPLAMMLDAGVPLLQALGVASKTVGNEYISQGVDNMLNGIERGESLLSTASASGLFNPLILQMIAVGEETGNVSDLLIDIADFYDQEVEYDLKRLAEAIEPILLVFMGAMVLVLALGVFLPMWELGAAYG